mgnify:CR=1 FL=1
MVNAARVGLAVEIESIHPTLQFNEALMRPAATIWPAYRALLDSGELERRAAAADARLTNCDLCARYCRVNRRETLVYNAGGYDSSEALALLDAVIDL